ncbi:BTB/POZ and MATH domain-containing protein 2-like [Triticum aestivum]|uniref:BTB/POZ and MATH domain-containing protein 2-like n=1 Tax=Triticum aestivum TaxID=4565 RepID=UPI001D034D4D|nr:BTB/POZ and MATH domain-containing protein 2-like [Triticum aestivum]
MGNIISFSGEGWSTCLTEAATGAHNFKVTNYSQLDGIGALNHVSSKTFSVGGYNWCIDFYPDTYVGHAFAQLSLKRRVEQPGVKVKFMLSFLGNDGKVYKGMEPVAATRAILFKDGIGILLGWEDPLITEKCKLQDDGCFTIRCDLTVLKTKHGFMDYYNRTQEVCAFTIPTPPSNLHKDFGRMLKDEDGANVTFIVGDKSFRAHSHVMAARSSAFRAKLLDLMTKEDPTKPVNVHDMTSGIFEALLHFMYADTLPYGSDFEKNRSKLQRLVSRNNDCVTSRCVLTVMRKHRTGEVHTFAIPTPPSNLHEDFGKMLKDKDDVVDVAFVVGDKLLRAHRHILAARSPAFKAELLDPMTKKDPTNPVNVHDMTFDIFEALLHFMYTNTLPHGSDLQKNGILWRLLAVGDRYGLDRLVTICGGKLCQNINEQTIATTLTLAEQHDRVRQKSACLAFVSSQDVLDVVKETDGFKHLMRSCHTEPAG